VKWFIEFDIEGYFDNIDHQILMQMLEKNIDDVKFLNVIRKMLRAGYLEDWKYHNTYSGTPQGGIISPILANIYLHELDCYMESLIQDYNKGKERRDNPEYTTIRGKVHGLNRKIRQLDNTDENRKILIDEKRVLQQRMHGVPSTDQHDPDYRRLRYCRYADDFVLGVIGPKSEAEALMEGIKAFLQERLKLKHSEAKSGLKHNTEAIRFLGYDISVINSEKVKRVIYGGQHTTRRTGKAHISLYAPFEKLQKFATYRQYGNWETMQGMHKAFLSQSSEAEITMQYSVELRGIAEYYTLADNFAKALWRLQHLWFQSWLKTMAHKHDTSVQKMSDTFNRGSYYAVRVKGKQGEEKEIKLFDLKSIDRKKSRGEKVDFPPLTFQFSGRTELLQRMNAGVCEYCEKEEGYFEVHHVRKLADIKAGKQPWERLMIARRRKTMILCINCHDRLHAGTLPDWKHLQKREMESRVH
jgi:RNA-directed DNA polymerase